MSSADNGEALPERLVKQRAKSGVFFVGSMGAVNLVVGFAGSLVLARMLLPSDFGIAAIGMTLMMVATSLGDGGLASGLIRREEPPTRDELRSALALQLGLTTFLAIVAAAIGVAIGGSGLVVALMMAGLPVAALQSPGRIVLSRELRFRVLATSEAVSVLAYYAWAVGCVIAGFGVWSLASAVVVRAVVLSGAVVYVAHLGRLLPSFRRVGALRPVIRFGVQFQAVSFAGMGRDQGLNAGIAAIAGVATLGYWSLAGRLLALPVLLFEPLHRVMFPLMSHMRAAGQDPARLLERGVAVAGTVAGVVLVAFAASASELVPSVFGEQWAPVAEIVQWVSASLLVAGPLAVVAVGFLYSGNQPSVVLKATILHTIVLYIVAFSLLPVVGPAAIGMGSLAGAIVDACVMTLAIRSRSEARPFRAHWPTLVAAAPAAFLGMAVTASAGPGFLPAALGGLTGAAAYLAITALLRPAVLADAAKLIADAVRNGVAKETPAPAPLPNREAVAAPTPT